jgi:ATP-binding cassette subfamily F protein uup
MLEMSSTSTPTKTGSVTVLKCDKLSKSYVGTPQFDEINFTLGRGQRVGLIGVNGAGKSTLMKCLARTEQADSGTVETLSNTNVVFVEQDREWGDKSVYEALYDGSSVQAAAARAYTLALMPENMEDIDMLTKATDLMEEASAWDYQAKGADIAANLNIGAEYMYRKLRDMSGGEKKRVSLASALLLSPDVLLLDEPTNHLDIDALDWLGEYLQPGARENKDLAVLLVTHDRHFLEKVCSDMVELDRGGLYRYSGNYASYLEQKAARYTHVTTLMCMHEFQYMHTCIYIYTCVRKYICT